MRKGIAVALLLGIGVLLAAQPVIYGRTGVDGVFHLQRAAQLERSLRYGILYPRWLPDSGIGLGFPLFNYYAPLSYYLVLPLRWIGLSLSASLLAGGGLALWVLALAMYLWIRDIFGETAGLAAALAAVYSPSILTDLHQRSAWPAMWALAWFPLTLWALRRSVAYSGVPPVIITALGYAAVVLTHNITALIVTPLLFGYALVLGFLYGFRPALRSVLVLLIALGLTAFFWMPAFLEQKYVQIHQVYLPSFFDYHNNFLSLAELLSPPRPVDPSEANFMVPVSLGWVQIALALVAWGPIGARLPREQRVQRWTLSLAALGLALLTLPVSTPLWDAFPILRYLQFPWRFLAPASLALAAMAGAGVAVLVRRRPFWLPLTAAGIMVFGLTWLFPPPWQSPEDPTPPDQVRFEGETGYLGGTSGGEYLPIWVQERPSAEIVLPLYEAAAPDYIIPRLDPGSLPADATVLQARYGLAEAELTLESPQPFRLRLLWYFFPGWYARLDDRPLSLFPDGPHGLIAADIPAGRHHLVVKFGDTPLRRWAWRISGFSLVLLIGAIVWAGRGDSRANRPAEQTSAVPWRAALACAGIAIALTRVKTFYLDRYDNPFRFTRFDGRQVRGVQVPLKVNFGGQLVLMGYDLSAPTVRADEPLGVTLYWRAVPPVTADYSIGLHLVDDSGHLYGQQDNIHPGNYRPTSRIGPDQYVRDVHRLTPWEGTPPGRYTLLVLAYDRESGSRLGLQDAAGTPLGTTTYPLARIEVTRPRRFPTTDELPLHQRLDADMGGSIQLVGSGPLPEQVEVGHSFLLTLYWRAMAPPSADYRARLRLLSEEGAIATEHLFIPGRDDHPTSSWAKGEIIRDVRSLFIPLALAQDPTRPIPAGRYTLHLDLLDAAGFPLTDGTDIGTLAVTVPERRFTLPEFRYPLGLRMGDMATLLGYDLSPTSLRPGETINLTLYWRAEAITERSYTVFVHLLGPDGRIYAQRDLPPGAGARPTTGWFPGEVVRDDYSLTLPPDAPAGEYHLAVGWYDPTSGQRVPIVDADGAPQGDHILLPTIIIVGS